MEYDDYDGDAESVPESGAIFMSNTLTKKESFKRKIFALPYTQAEFVKKIKVGMILFIFEFKKRQLFGVYQASSDGAMDIVPHAFSSSGRRFPAQVRFTPIWHCYPLSEREFKDAIIENYYSFKRFKCGLSEDQVRRLLFLFSSRKMRNEMVPRPVGKDRRSVGDDRFELSERRYRESTENDEFNHATFSDYHMNSYIEEDEELLDDRVNNEGNVYPSAQGNVLSKRRRIDTDARLLESDMDGLHNYGSLQTFQTDSPMDLLDEVSNLTAVRQLLAVEKARKQNQMDKIRNAVLSSESLMDPLDIRTDGNDRFMQRNRLFDEYNMDNGFPSERYEKPLGTRNHTIDDDRLLFDDSVRRNQNIRNAVLSSESMMDPSDIRTDGDDRFMQRNRLFDEYKMDNGFPSERYEKHLGTRKHAIDDDRFLFDDSVRRNQNINDLVEPTDYGDGNLSFRRQPLKQVIEDQQCSMNRKLEKRYHLDGKISPFSAFEHNASLLRETSLDRRLPISNRIDTEPNIVPCDVENRSSAKFSRPLHCSHNITPDRKYPIVEGRVTENLADDTFRSATSIRNGGYCERVGVRVVDEKDYHTHIGPDITFGCPSSSDKLLPEKGLSQLNASHNFGPSRTTFDDATITRATPYIPEHLKISHGFDSSMAATKLNSSLVRENPHHGSQEDFYSSYKSRLLFPYASESKKSSRSLDITNEFGNKGLPTNTSGAHCSFSGPQRSFLHEATTHVDLNTSVHVPVNDRGSLFSKPFLTRPDTDHEKNGERGLLFAYPPKSSGKHFDFDENPRTASQHEMDKLAGKDFISSEAMDLSLGKYHHSERDLTHYENQLFGIPSNMNCQVNHEIFEAPPHFDTNVKNRKSVFSRLTSKEEIRGGGEDRNDSGFDSRGCFVAATSDQVMEMAQQSNNNLSPKKSRAVGQPKHREITLGEKQVHNLVEIKSSAMEKKKLKDDEHIPIEENVDEVPNETRITDFKRRSNTKKILVGASNEVTSANEEAGNPTKTTLKRRKLVRPVFRKTESGTDTVCSNQNSLQVPAQILENFDNRNCKKVISICDSEMPDDNAKLNNVLGSHSLQSMGCDIKEHSSPKEQDLFTELHKTSMDCDNIKELSGSQEQKDIKINVLPSLSNEPKEHKSSLVLGLHSDTSPVAITEVNKPSMDSNIKEQLSSEEQNDITADVLPFSSIELTSTVGLHIDNSSQALLTVLHKTSMDCNYVKELSSNQEQKDIKINVLPSSSNELEEHKSSLELGLHIDTSPLAITEVNKSSMDTNIKEQLSSEDQNDISVDVLPFSSTDLTAEHKSSTVGLHTDNSPRALLTEHHKPSVDSDIVKELSGPQEQNDITVDVFPVSSIERTAEHKSSTVGLHIDNSPQALLTEHHKPSMDCDNIKELSDPQEQNDIRVHVLPSSNTELTNEHKSSIVDHHKEPSSPEEQKDIKVHVLSSSSTELAKENRTSTVSLHIDNSSQALLTEFQKPSMGCNNIKELSIPEEQTRTELKEHKTSIVDLPIDNSSQAPLSEISPHEAVDIQTSVEAKNVDSTANCSLNLEESSSSVGLEHGDGCSNNPIVEKGPTRTVKRKKIIRKVKKKTVKKVKETGTEPLLNESERVS